MSARITNRVSYQRFERMYKILREKGLRAGLEEMHQIFDEGRLYGTATNARAAKESLEFLIKEKGL